MSKAVRSGPDGLALSFGSLAHDAPRLIIPLIRLDDRSPRPSSAAIAAWARLAGDAHDLVVVLDDAGQVLALSPQAAELFGELDADEVIGQHLLDALHLVDFNPTPGDASMYADRIPPLLALASDALSRGLLRVRTAGRTITLDAVAAPIHDGVGSLVGAVTFLTKLGG